MREIKTVNAKGQEGKIKGAFELEAFDLYPNFTSEDLNHVKARSFASLQLRAKNAVRKLLRSKEDRILVLCGSEEILELYNAKTLVKLVKSDFTNFKALIAPTKEELLGNPQKNLQGAVELYELLILKAALFLDHPKWITRMQRALAQNPNLKLIICGDVSDLSALSLMWPALDPAIHSDYVLEFPSLGGVDLIASLVLGLKEELGLKDFNFKALHLLAIWSCRQSGDRRWLGIPEVRLRSILAEANDYAKGNEVTEREVLKAIAANDFRVNFLAESELRDHRDRQILISTKGAVIGQINGLSVVEMAGSSYEFGEPVRITASLRAGGEGDIIDIERKAELAGQIHAKAMMIINGYITREFGSQTPLPVSASLVFEQSYSEIDGDSASLTGLCAVISCLSNIPLRQDLAVTGAVDQFGDVQPVGGVNEKIEGFFKVCRLHGLSGSQGVIIPSSCVNQLVLRPAIVKAVEQGKFHIYTVSHVEEAFKLLSLVDWGDEDTEGSVVNRIVERLNEIALGKEEDVPWWKFWAR